MIKTNKAARCLFIAIAALIMVCLTSCVDYTQSITLKDGKYIIYIKVTMSKALLAMAGEDANDWADRLIEGDDFPAGFNKVVTESEVGAQCTVAIDTNTRNKDEKAIIPTIKKNKVVIPFLPSEATDELVSTDDDTNDMVMAIMSSAKCRILVSKKIVSNIASAYFEGKGGQNYSIAAFDYGDIWGLEVPFTVLMESGRYNFDNIVILQG